MLPTTEDKLLKVSSLLKRGGYKSVKNYLSRIKEHHITSGFDWNDRLDLIAKKCARLVLRGLGGAHRSEPFDLIAVSETLKLSAEPLVRKGPIDLQALIVSSTLFMLRDVEASSLETRDIRDITFTGDSASLCLPVSKVDWQVKGCTRTWHCLRDQGYPCVMHILKEHVEHIEIFNGDEAALFPTADRSLYAKQGVVDTISRAVDISGGSAKDTNGNWRISGGFLVRGHFAIGALTLSPYN